jgi:hypothetical protein
MKTEWWFRFETKGLFFQKEHKYIGTTNDAVSLDIFDTLQKISFDFRIVPEKESKHPSVDQSGTLYITIPRPYDEKSKSIAYTLAHMIAQRINFESCEFRILGGAFFGKRIAETPEEEKEVGDAPYFAELHIVEVEEPYAFDSKSFADNSKAPLDTGLVSQYNESKKAHNPIDKFLGFFKILESRYTSTKQKLKECLENSEELFKIYRRIFKFGSIEQARHSFTEFIGAIVHARHRCAHLKANKSFGYVPVDPRIEIEVKPFLIPLEILTYEVIMHNGRNV